MLEVQDLVAGYGATPVVQGISFTLSPGEVVGLAAPNGIGKTTLMRALVGRSLVSHRSLVRIDGRPYLGSLAKNRQVYMAAGAGEDLSGRIKARDLLIHAARCWKSADDPLEVGARMGVDGFWRSPLRRCSQGMAQQLSLAVASVTAAPYTLLDEPMNALDPLRSDQAEKEIRSMAARGRGVLVSSHLLESLERLCDRILFLHGDGVEEVRCNVPLREYFFIRFDESARGQCHEIQ